MKPQPPDDEVPKPIDVVGIVLLFTALWFFVAEPFCAFMLRVTQ